MECGLGKENRTPTGVFTIEKRIPDPHWFPADGPSIPPGDPRNLLGSRWLGFRNTDRHTGLGIHEARNVADIGREASNGCIRLKRGDVEEIFDLCPTGTPVRILQ
jgi:lipoprotein-anchoring transpeptidase ErfK/SrfK